MENYKEKYKHALEKCKKEFNLNNLEYSNLTYSHEQIKQILEHIFPELKESEESKIIDALKIAVCSYCSPNHNYVNTIPKGRLIDWIEKQGEKNKQNFWEKCNCCEYFDGYDICLHKKNFGSVTDELKENCKNNNFFVEKQGEQKLDDCKKQ